MPNMSLKKNAMPSQDPNVRNKNFLEVALGYTEEQALDEAMRRSRIYKPQEQSAIEAHREHCNLLKMEVK